MPLPEAPRKRGTILDASAYGKKTADVSTKPATKTALSLHDALPI